MSMPCKVGGISHLSLNASSTVRSAIVSSGTGTFDLAPSGHLPNLPRTAAQKAAEYTILVHCFWTGLCIVIAAQPSPDG
jgi:hypothetical protein